MHYSYPLKGSKNDPFVNIQETSADLDNTKPQHKTRPSRSFGKYVRGWIWKFFPWIGEPPPQQLDELHKQPSFPWLGLLCLLTALSTLGFSALVFCMISDIPQVDNKFLKPASWLSAIISVNSIVLHIALAEGVTTAWWYRASRADVTLQELHEIYTMGTSTMSVLLSGRRFNYVAMGTIFVATVPLNGFLLQNTIALAPSTFENITDVTLPLVQELPQGFSADIVNGSVGSWSEAMMSAANSMDGVTEFPAGAFEAAFEYIETTGCSNKNNTAICTNNVKLTSFNMTCETKWDRDYDLRPSSHTNDSTYRETVFSSQVLWNFSTPNSIRLEIVQKPNQTCQGQFLRKTCQLRAAKVLYPIQVNSDTGFFPGSNRGGYLQDKPIVSLNSRATLSDFPVQEELPTYTNDGHENSTLGGIAQWLGNRFNSSIEWIYKDGSWSTNSSGSLARAYRTFPQLIPQDPDGSWDYFNPRPDNASWCKNVYIGQDWLWESGYYDESVISSFTPVTKIFFTVHRLMLGLSVAQAQTQSDKARQQWRSNLSSDDPDFYNTWDEQSKKPGYGTFLTMLPNSTQTQECLRYNIRWQYYWASVTITVFIVLMVMPLFYGFWTLDRRGTLSPFETAAAFGAPALQDADMKKGTEVLLKEIGQRPVNFTASTTSLPVPQKADPMVK